MFTLPVAVLDGAFPVVFTAGLDEPVGLFVPGEAGGMLEPAGARFVFCATAVLASSMVAADIAMNFLKASSLDDDLSLLGQNMSRQG